MICEELFTAESIEMIGFGDHKKLQVVFRDSFAHRFYFVFTFERIKKILKIGKVATCDDLIGKSFVVDLNDNQCQFKGILI